MIYFHQQVAIKIDAVHQARNENKRPPDLSSTRLLYIVVYLGSYVFKGHYSTHSHKMTLISDANSSAVYCRESETIIDPEIWMVICLLPLARLLMFPKGL